MVVSKASALPGSEKVAYEIARAIADFKEAYEIEQLFL